ncbi:uncharacterized protein KD926_006767 [Aspergillus affinis]|uniref:uncharacterized protein n=1 Tax=Aspergillus affinis TaxID=1070780 RepID=UPI0022FEFEF1|nr:uncharacterized protein KD926_006767 [Aspergillus affinis]KAI9041529.1 hypothetical protein KD926_006767 [Aspergillus affinis]
MQDSSNHGPAVLPVQFVERLISRLGQQLPPSQRATDSASPLPPVLPSDAKPLMLTLHCLFPNELLLALDILDRGLVRRLAQQDASQESSNPTTDPSRVVFFVISASAAPSTSAKKPVPTRTGQMGYEVRLQAWNCTCPVFMLAAFRDLSFGSAPEMEPARHAEGPRDGDDVPRVKSQTCCYAYGGWLAGEPTRTSPPICKHLLACLLMARCPGAFETTAQEADPALVPAEELAGWCAGWSG